MEDKNYIRRLEIALIISMILLVVGGMSFATNKLITNTDLVSLIGVIQVLYGFGVHMVIRK